ncbi:MAG: winged helix DNA-binding domain-containing protein [Devosiaceae bacterium]|nr:winged helix DNA-binding domain-containing protein [Devosiaceae bacterium]
MLRLSNADARKLWLNTTGLAQTPTGPVDVMALIRRMGFLQIDTIRNVSRAHHHILWSRNQNYREKMLWPRLGETGDLFEHFTHDASLIPMEYYPMWGMQFDRLGKRVAKWYQPGLARDAVRAVYDRIAADGPLSTHAFDTKVEGERKMWARPPHKKALDMMWYQGKLATSHRQNFTKFYDLGERVFPVELRAEKHSEQAQTDWLCTQALERLSFASVGEIKRFWDVLSAQEVKDWLNGREGVLRVEVEGVDGKMHFAFAPTDIEKILEKTDRPTSRLRIINPFDPAIRDRSRLQRLFGFEYRNEMFVPKAKRKWGYYVYPLLEGTRFVGRIEIKAERDKGQMYITGFWPEPGVKWGRKRKESLGAELTRFARFVGIDNVDWQCRQI